MSYQSVFPVQPLSQPTTFPPIPEMPPSRNSVPVQTLGLPRLTESNVQQHSAACPPRKKLKPVHAASGNKERVEDVMTWAQSTTSTRPPNAIKDTDQRPWLHSDSEDSMSALSFAEDQEFLDKLAPQHVNEEIGYKKAPMPSSPRVSATESENSRSAPLQDTLLNSGSSIYRGSSPENSAKNRGLLFSDDSISFDQSVNSATENTSGSGSDTETDSDNHESEDRESEYSCSACGRIRRSASSSSSECDFPGCSGDSSDSDSELSLATRPNVTIPDYHSDSSESISDSSESVNDFSENESDSSDSESDFSDHSSITAHDDSLSIDKREFRRIVIDILDDMEKSPICWGPGALDTLQALAEEFAVNELKGVSSLSTC
jgi:hypothetical protein